MSLFGFTCSRSFGWVTCLLIVVSISFTAVEAQSPQQQTTQKPSEDEVVTVKTNLVNINVLVKDNKGNYISNLEAEDFIVFENGVEQKLEFFDSPLSRDKEKNKPKVSTEGGQQLISREQPRNLVALVLDGQTTDLPNLKRVREGTIKYIREQITPQDTVAVFAVTSGLQLLQPFTQDKTRLIAAVAGAYGTSTSSKNFETRDISENIEKLREQSNTATGPITTAAAGSQAAQAMIASRVLQQFIRLRTALSVQQSRPILAALAAICEGLRAVPGKKTLVLFSQGFVTPAVLDWQVQSTIDLANRANVAIYIIDSAGLREGGTVSGSLVPATPLAGVSASTNQEQRIQTTGGENVFDTVRQEGVNRQYDILFRISGDTGGEFLKGSNDIARGLARIDEQIRSRYTLAYHSTDQNFDGAFRKIKIELRKPEGQVISRPGYYAIAHEDVVLLSPEEKKLAASIVTAEANPDFPMFVELSSFRSREDLYVVPLSFEVPSSAVKFERKDDKQWIHLEIVGLIRDARDKILSRLGGNFDVGLTAAQYNSIVNNNIFYRQDLELPVGGYKLELVVRDKLSGKMAGKTEQFLLPQMDAGFMASPVVLSRQVVSSPQLASTAEPGDVLSLGPVRIRPSPSHEFRADDNLIIFFEIYNAARNTETSTPLVRVTVTLKKDNKTAIGPVDYVLTDVLKQPVPHLTFAKYISLKGLSPGKYMAVLETRDMVNRDLVKQTLPFIVAP